MARTFNQTVAEAKATMPVISAAETQRRMQADPITLLIDVRDAADIATTGMIPGAANISLGTLTYKADNEVPMDWRDPRLADRSRRIITVCALDPMGSLAGKLLKDMGFTNVSILEGGMGAWIAAGFPTVQPSTAG